MEDLTIETALEQADAGLKQINESRGHGHITGTADLDALEGQPQAEASAVMPPFDDPDDGDDDEDEDE